MADFVLFPKWKYAFGKDPVVVTTPDEEAALEGDWKDAPVTEATKVKK